MQIHELNNFTGTLGAGAYLAVDDGNDTGKLSTQQLLAATEARIDNIIAGPAPSAQEVTDARLGADGVVYPSLGDAIRDQVTDLKDELNESQFIDSSIQLTTGNISGWYNGTSVQTHASYTHTVINNPFKRGVKYVELYIATATTLGTVWFVSNGVSTKWVGSSGKTIMIEVPSDADELVVNFWGTDISSTVNLICDSAVDETMMDNTRLSVGKYYVPKLVWFPNTNWLFTTGASTPNTNYFCTQKIAGNALPTISFVSGDGTDTYINVWKNGATAGYYLVKTGVWKNPSNAVINRPDFDEYAICYMGTNTDNIIVSYKNVEDAINENALKVVMLPDIEKQNATLDNVKQISVIGDSISHGANCPNMYLDAWASLMRGFLQSQYANKNYGYSHLLSSIANGGGTYNEVHTVTLGSGWTGTNYDAESIGGYTIKNNTSQTDVTIALRMPQKHFRLIYSTGSGYGQFEVLVNGTSRGIVDCDGTANKFNLTSEFDGDAENAFTITIHKLDSATVCLNGIYYYDNWDDVMFNNYAQSGIKLTDIPNDVLTQCCNADLVFFTLGTNGYSTQADYSSKIDHIISQFSSDSVINTRLLVVMNFMWNTREEDSFVKRENKRLADSVPHSVYVDFNKVLGGLTTTQLQNIGFLTVDSAHPSPLGHKFIAEYMASVMNLRCKLKSMIGKY